VIICGSVSEPWRNIIIQQIHLLFLAEGGKEIVEVKGRP